MTVMSFCLEVRESIVISSHRTRVWRAIAARTLRVGWVRRGEKGGRVGEGERWEEGREKKEEEERWEEARGGERERGRNGRRKSEGRRGRKGEKNVHTLTATLIHTLTPSQA